jgi:tRNA G18 (ribose-2'-O)-methylase SpoU
VHIVRVHDLESEPGLADYLRLTDVVLRRLSEPADGLYIAESTKVIERAIGAGHRPRSVLLQEKWLDEIAPLVEQFDGPLFVAEPDLLAHLTGFEVHRGALAAMQRPRLASVEEIVADARRIVVLDGLVDHTNVGAIFRSAAALGADAVLITPRCADPLYRRSVRVSMGTVLQVPWTRLPDWPDGARVLKELGFHIAALALADGAQLLDDFAARPPERVALLMGTEGDGLSSRAMALADSIVTIPMHHGVDSLNVAAATALALYALRVR